MKTRFFTLLTISMFLLISCQNEMHLISDANVMAKVDSQFQVQKKLAVAKDSALFDVFNQPLTTFETEALKFLYAYMPMSDLADYDGEFFLKNIQASAQAKSTMPWSANIPENIFRHFVLPIRVNTETLDTARLVFYKDLKDRVAGLSMENAVLEVNHWCHEHVIYRSTDDRTSSPLNCVKTTFGRCGEESTFLVTALRSVGIPARQCYTPRWAHCDDNHAWVEAWVDGEWKYLGACEPESELNKGWFTGPSKRAMLVHTTVFGDYQGKEQVLEKTAWYTKINVLANYTQTKKIVVKVVDQKNQPVANTQVEFKLYNYAEFYPLTTQTTNRDGLASFETGLGDLLIWVAKNNLYNYQKVTVGLTDTLIMQLTAAPAFISTKFVPPADIYKSQENKSTAAIQNAIRIQQEDSIRALRLATFPDSLQIVNWANKNHLPLRQTLYFISQSAGNFQTIQTFLLAPSKNAKWKFALLEQISEKDLRDISLAVLLDHLNYSDNEQVLNPRIGNEMSTAYKSYFQNAFDTNFQNACRNDINFLVKWINSNIKIDQSSNYYHVPITPIGIFQLKRADENSRNILFVAMCRSFGIEARLDPEFEQAQVFVAHQSTQNNWKTIEFEKQYTKVAPFGQLLLSFKKKQNIAIQYGLNFSIAQIKNGIAQTIHFENNPIFNQLPTSLNLPIGNYILLTGNRLNDGSVLSNIYRFEIKNKQSTALPFEFLENDAQNIAMGSIDMQQTVDFRQAQTTLASFKNKNGLAILCLDLPAEPSKHAIVELQNAKKQWEELGFPLLVLLKQTTDLVAFNQKYGVSFPTNTSFAKGENLSVQSDLKLKNWKTNAPLLMLVSQNDQIKFISAGYAIGNIDLIMQSMQAEIICLKNCTK